MAKGQNIHLVSIAKQVNQNSGVPIKILCMHELSILTCWGEGKDYTVFMEFSCYQLKHIKLRWKLAFYNIVPMVY